MAFKDYAEALLHGGLPAVLDYGRSAGNTQGDTKPEQVAPEPTAKDVVPGFSLGNDVQFTSIAVGVIAVLAIIYLIKD